MESDSGAGGVSGRCKTTTRLLHHTVSLDICTQGDLTARQQGVELGGPGKVMGLLEMELRADLVSDGKHPDGKTLNILSRFR